MKGHLGEDYCGTNDEEITWWVAEYYCENGELQSKIINCPNGCEDGACVGAECTDTDGGKDYSVKGIASGYARNGDEAELEDTCMEAGEHVGQLGEYFCLENGVVAVDFYSCPAGCQDGACVVTEILPQITIQVSEEATGNIKTVGVDTLTSTQTYQIKVTATPTDILPENHLVITQIYVGDEVKSLYWSNMPALAVSIPETIQFTYQIPPEAIGSFKAKAFVWNGWLGTPIFNQLIPPEEAVYSIS